MKEPKLVDFEAGMDDDQASEALHRWKMHPKLLSAVETALNYMENDDYPGDEGDVIRELAKAIGKATEVSRNGGRFEKRG